MRIKLSISNVEERNFDEVPGIFDYPFEEYLASSPGDIVQLITKLNHAIETTEPGRVRDDLISLYNAIRIPEYDIIKGLLLDYITEDESTKTEYDKSSYIFEDDIIARDSTIEEAVKEFEFTIWEGIDSGKYRKQDTMETNFRSLLKDLQADYENTELFQNFIRQCTFFPKNPSPVDYILYYLKHRKTKHVPAIIKFVRYYRYKYTLVNINLDWKDCNINPTPLSSPKFVQFDIYKECEINDDHTITGKGEAYDDPDNESAVLSIDFPLKIEIIDRNSSLLLRNWEESIQTPLEYQLRDSGTIVDVELIKIKATVEEKAGIYRTSFSINDDEARKYDRFWSKIINDEVFISKFKEKSPTSRLNDSCFNMKLFLNIIGFLKMKTGSSKNALELSQMCYPSQDKKMVSNWKPVPKNSASALTEELEEKLENHWNLS